jgi:hypothetical protein
MTPPDDSWMPQWLAEKAWLVISVLVAVVWKQLHGTIKTNRDAVESALLAHKEEDDKLLKALHEEQSTQRGHIGKLFDKLEQHSMRAEDRHHELLKALHEGLSSKADK